MFCNKCGTQLPEQAGFCPSCGEKTFSQTNRDRIPKKNKNCTIGMVAVGVVAVLVLVAVSFLFGGRDYKEVIDIYMKNSFSNDAKTIEKTFSLLPEEMLEAVLIMLEDEMDIVGMEELVEYVQETKEEYMDNIEQQFGEDYTYNYEILEEEDYSQSEIRELNDTFSEGCEEVGVDWDREIEEGKDVTLEVTVSSKDGETSSTYEVTISLIKIGRTWYLEDFSL